MDIPVAQALTAGRVSSTTMYWLWVQTRGGGNCANALTAASRLGADTYLVTKLGKDSIGDQIVSELENDGVNTQFVLRDDGLSAFGYMIVDKQGKPAPQSVALSPRSAT